MKSKSELLKAYVDTFAITKISFGKLFISDLDGVLVVEVTSKGKTAFSSKDIFSHFNTNESELLILLKNKFPYKTIDSVIFL